jgi:hypothetical protein
MRRQRPIGRRFFITRRSKIGVGEMLAFEFTLHDHFVAGITV